MKPMANLDRIVEANKPFTMRGQTFQPGEPVDADALGISDHKLSQLLGQRILRPSALPRE